MIPRLLIAALALSPLAAAGQSIAPIAPLAPPPGFDRNTVPTKPLQFDPPLRVEPVPAPIVIAPGQSVTLPNGQQLIIRPNEDEADRRRNDEDSSSIPTDPAAVRIATTVDNGRQTGPLLPADQRGTASDEGRSPNERATKLTRHQPPATPGPAARIWTIQATEPPIWPPEPRAGARNAGLDEAIGQILDGMLTEVEPGLQGLAESLGNLESRFGPALADLGVLIDDIGNYEAPRRLPNGDILITRRADAPPPPPIGDALGQLTRPDGTLPPDEPASPDTAPEPEPPADQPALANPIPL